MNTKQEYKAETGSIQGYCVAFARTHFLFQTLCHYKGINKGFNMTSFLSQITGFSRFRIRNLRKLIPFFHILKLGISSDYNMNVFLSQMAVFSQLGIRIDVNLIPFFKITEKGINKGFSTNAFLSQIDRFFAIWDKKSVKSYPFFQNNRKRDKHTNQPGFKSF